MVLLPSHLYSTNNSSLSSVDKSIHQVIAEHFSSPMAEESSLANLSASEDMSSSSTLSLANPSTSNDGSLCSALDLHLLHPSLNQPLTISSPESPMVSPLTSPTLHAFVPSQQHVLPETIIVPTREHVSSIT